MQKVLDEWCLAFLSIFQSAPKQLEMALNKVGSGNLDSSLDEIFRGKMHSTRFEGLDFGMQELRTYFRLFMLSSVLLLFMFCSRISKSKCKSTIAI